MDTRQISNDTIKEYIKRKKENYRIKIYYDKIQSLTQWDTVFGCTEDELEHYDKPIDGYFTNKGDRIASCMNYWECDIYHESKVIDMRKTYRCMDKFCTNCKRVRTAGYLIDFLPHFNELSEKYIPMMITLTVPNCERNELENTINKLFVEWKLYYRLFYSKKTAKYAYKERQYDIVGAIRALEITFNAQSNTYHPHLHAIVFIDGLSDSTYIEKNIKGEYNYKTGNYNAISRADIEIRDLWTRLWNGVDRRVKEYDIMPYMCDIRPVDGVKGILEVLKYAFKTSDIIDYSVFEELYFALYHKRAKQGYGKLYNLKFEDYIEEGSDEILDNMEMPEWETLQIKQLITGKYSEYEKVSRFKKSQVLELINEHLED